MPRALHYAVDGQYFCPVCNEPVKLETAKTDGDGQAIHDDCYLKQVSALIPPKVQKPPTT